MLRDPRVPEDDDPIPTKEADHSGEQIHREHWSEAVHQLEDQILLLLRKGEDPKEEQILLHQRGHRREHHHHHHLGTGEEEGLMVERIHRHSHPLEEVDPREERTRRRNHHREAEAEAHHQEGQTRRRKTHRAVRIRRVGSEEGQEVVASNCSDHPKKRGRYGLNEYGQYPFSISIIRGGT